MTSKCECPECAQHIEFPEEMSGQTITCPSCEAQLVLPQADTLAVGEKHAKPFLERGVLGWVSKKIKDHHDKVEAEKAARKTYIDRIIFDIKNNIAFFERPSFPLQKGEILCWVEPASLIEIKTVGRHYEGGSRGVSIRVVKGVRFNLGRHAGHSVSETAAVATSEGEMIITNKRLAFVGDPKCLSLKIDNLVEIRPAQNGLRFSDGKKASKMFRYHNKKNADIVCEVLNCVMNYS